MNFEQAVIKMLAYAKAYGFDTMVNDYAIAPSVKNEVKRLLEADA